MARDALLTLGAIFVHPVCMGHSLFWVAALADFTGVIVHGILGHRILFSPLGRDRLFATSAFGDEEMTRRILLVAFHLVTAVFACSGIAFVLLALGRVEGTATARFIGAMHLSFAVTAVGIVGERALAAFRRPIPIAFGSVMTTVGVLGWLG